MNLFQDKIKCDYCGEGHFHPRNSSLFNGFRDGDTGQIVCFKCRDAHYFKKQKGVSGAPVTYTEIPITYAQM